MQWKMIVKPIPFWISTFDRRVNSLVVSRRFVRRVQTVDLLNERMSLLFQPLPGPVLACIKAFTLTVINRLR